MESRYIDGGSTSCHNNLVLGYDVDQNIMWDTLPKLPVAYFGLAKLTEQLVRVG